MRKPPPRAGSKSSGDGGPTFAGGRAMERVRQFERARGLGPPVMAEAPDLPRGTARAKQPGGKAKRPAAKRAKPAAKPGKTSTKRKRRTAPSRRKGSTS